MDCKEAQRLIPEYLNDELEGRTMDAFLNHIDTCGECREELCIQYLVKEGTARLEDGNSFDLNHELKVKMEASRKSVKRQRIIAWIIYVLEFMAILAVMFILFLVFYQ